MIFHELCIDSAKESDGSIDLLTDISAITILFNHLHDFAESALRFFDREKKFFLESGIIGNHKRED